MNEEQYEEISDKLEKIIKLLAAQSVGNKNKKEAIGFLSSLGFQPKYIAELVGTTPNTVSVTLNELKKAGVKKNG